MNPIINMFKPTVTEDFICKDEEFEQLGIKLKKKMDVIFGRSMAIRAVDAGSDNAPEIELVNLTTPHYDIERFGITFVASPRHADTLMVTGAVTLNMAQAVRKVYEATPSPKLVIALGDDACSGGIFLGSYAVLGGVDKILPVDLKIPGNPPTPHDIMRGLLALMEKLQQQ
ncbi:NADH-quinone oxidoreductase subunit B family protein [Candidatus Woesearchaeota archaeon]|nr:NADH-quinone oxidoreductase subunit B family protein [Candidatus Woesearchaeota archaeon]